MKTPTFTKSIVALLAALTCGATTAVLFAEEKEQKVPLDQVPAVVRETLEANAKAQDATLGEVTRETEDGKVVYEAEATRSNGTKIEIEVSEDGKLLEIETEDEDEDDD